MSAAATDKFLLTGVPGTATNLAAPGYTIGNSSITVTSTADFPTTTGVIFGIDVVEIVNGEEERVDGSYCVFAGVVTGPTTIGSLTLLYGTPQNYAAGAMTRVYITISTYHNQRLIEGILAEHKQDGTHGAIHADSVTSPSGTITNLTVNSLTISGSTPTAGWSALGQTLTYAGNNGNKEFTVTAPADLRSTLSAGMKIQVTRATAPPTQCMSFMIASSQYATKTSPTGMTTAWTAFTLEASVKLNSYPTSGNDATIISRVTASGGFALVTTPAGVLRCYYRDSGGNITALDSNQSLPLNKWIHVAGVVTSTSSKTGALYLNGTPLTFNSTIFSAATSMAQSGPLQIGATNSSFFLDGYVSEARIWSVAQSQANIRANMAISLTGSETNLVGLFQGNGNFNDKTTNANNLTASGGAIATQTGNPYNNIEYAVITSVTYSAPNTTITLSTGDTCNIPNMTLNTALYATDAAAYGLPNDLSSNVGRRLVYIPINNTISTSSTTGSPFAPVQNITFTIPANCSSVKVCVYCYAYGSGAGASRIWLYNGSNTTANQVAVAYTPPAASFVTLASPIAVTPGSTFTLNAYLQVDTGTAAWNAAAGQVMNAVWVETA